MIIINDESQALLRKLHEETDLKPADIIHGGLLLFQAELHSNPPREPIDWSFLSPLVEGIRSFGTLFSGDGNEED